jgi:predicted AlkP superfamily phosphohydrolase/phosphomutase
LYRKRYENQTALRRVVVIGLDGASLNLIRSWVDEGRLPNLGLLLQNGASGRLRSTVQPFTAQAWTTMVTGVNAARHRLFDFWERDPDAYGFRLSNASARAAPALWTVLGNRGRRAIVVNVPMTYPPEPLPAGVMVSGRDTPGLRSNYTYPSSLKGELAGVLGADYVIVPDDWRWMRLGRPDSARKELLNEVAVRFATMRHLMRTRDWDFCMFVVGATDGAAHFFWRWHDASFPGHDSAMAELGGDVLFEVYQLADGYIGKLLQDLSSDVAVVVVSDHGSGSVELREIRLNCWLHEGGWLHFTEGAGSEARAMRVLTKGIADLKGLAYKTIPHQRLAWLRRVWPDRWRSRLTESELFAHVDWSRTRAFSEGRRGNIWINVKGRDPQGIVQAGAEYEALRSEIIASLQTARDPVTGDALFRRIWRREELFDGPYLETIPDLLVETDAPSQFRVDKGRPGESAIRRLADEEMANLVITGDHRMDGTLILYAPGIRPGVVVSGAEIRDIFPTVLHLMGESIPVNAEGRVLEEAFEPSWLGEHPAVRSDAEDQMEGSEGYSYSSEEKREVEEHLAGLGYLE